MKLKFILLLLVLVVFVTCCTTEVREYPSEKFFVKEFDDSNNLSKCVSEIMNFGAVFQDNPNKYAFGTYPMGDVEEYYVVMYDWETGKLDTIEQFVNFLFYSATAPISGDSVWVLTDYNGIFCSKGAGKRIWPKEKITIVGSDYGVGGIGPMNFNVNNGRICVRCFCTNYDISDDLTVTPKIPMDKLNEWRPWSLWNIVSSDSLKYYNSFGVRHFESDSISHSEEQMIYNEDDSVYVQTTTASDYVVLFNAKGDSICRKEFKSKQFVAKRSCVDYDPQKYNEFKKYMESNCWYGNIYYDKYRNRYIRIMKMPDTNIAGNEHSMTIKNDKLHNFNVVIADKDFNVKYEVKFRNTYVSSEGCLIREEGCYFVEWQKGEKARILLYDFK